MNSRKFGDTANLIDIFITDKSNKIVFSVFVIWNKFLKTKE